MRCAKYHDDTMNDRHVALMLCSPARYAQRHAFVEIILRFWEHGLLKSSRHCLHFESRAGKSFFIKLGVYAEITITILLRYLLLRTNYFLNFVRIHTYSWRLEIFRRSVGTSPIKFSSSRRVSSRQAVLFKVRRLFGNETCYFVATLITERLIKYLLNSACTFIMASWKFSSSRRAHIASRAFRVSRLTSYFHRRQSSRHKFGVYACTCNENPLPLERRPSQ